ncbi:MAG TPA: ABC transporter permease, partial [Cutibacterium acnes]|nr:ABC transporter permease [Cutibacterium acnes]
MSTESLKPAASKEATSPTAATASQTEATSHRSFPWNDLWVTVAAFVLAFIVSAIVMVAADPAINKEWSYLFSRPDALSDSWAQISSAYAALFQGAFGSWQALTATTAQSA